MEVEKIIAGNKNMNWLKYSPMLKLDKKSLANVKLC
jgi:hypothetical protein